MSAKSICTSLSVQGSRKDPTTGAARGVSTKAANLFAPQPHPGLYVAPRDPAKEAGGGSYFSTIQVLCNIADQLLIWEGIKQPTHLTQASLHLHC